MFASVSQYILSSYIYEKTIDIQSLNEESNRMRKREGSF